MFKDYLEELYDKQALKEIKGELISLPHLKKILKKKSDGSISHLINSGKMRSLKIAGKTYVTKPDLYLYFCPVTESRDNKDYQLDSHYKHFFGLDEEDILIPKKSKIKVDDTKGKRKVLNDDKGGTKKEPNTGGIRLRIKI